MIRNWLHGGTDAIFCSGSSACKHRLRSLGKMMMERRTALFNVAKRALGGHGRALYLRRASLNNLIACCTAPAHLKCRGRNACVGTPRGTIGWQRTCLKRGAGADDQRVTRVTGCTTLGHLNCHGMVCAAAHRSNCCPASYVHTRCNAPNRTLLALGCTHRSI